MDELRKHIRNAMLALNLIIASFLIVGSLPLQSVYQRATDEARAIRAMADRWSSLQTEGLLRKWIEQDSSRQKRLAADVDVITAKVERPPAIANDLPAANAGNDVSFAFYPQPTTNVPIPEGGQLLAAPLFVANARDGRDAGLPRNIETIGQFKTFWNALPQASKLLWVKGLGPPVQTLISSRGQATDTTSLPNVKVSIGSTREPYSQSGARFVNAQDRTYRGQYSYVLLDRADGNVQKLENGKTPVFELVQKNGVSTNFYAYVGMDFDEYDAHLQALISDGFPIPPGAFNDSFSNVKDVLGAFDGFRIADIDAFVSFMSRTTAEEAKLFGLSVPQALVFTWGSMIIFLAHAFVVAHVHAYLRHYDYSKEEMTDWLGDHDSLVSKAFSGFFLIGTPIIGSTYLVIRLISANAGWSSLLLSGTGLLLLGASCTYLGWLLMKHWRAMTWQRKFS